MSRGWRDERTKNMSDFDTLDMCKEWLWLHGVRRDTLMREIERAWTARENAALQGRPRDYKLYIRGKETSRHPGLLIRRRRLPPGSGYRDEQVNATE